MTASERRRFPVLVIAAGAAILIWLWLFSSEIRQMQMIYTYAVVLLGGLALLTWWLVAGAGSRRARWAPLLVVAGAATLFLAAFRVKGITGDWIPVVESRFGRPETATATAAEGRVTDQRAPAESAAAGTGGDPAGEAGARDDGRGGDAATGGAADAAGGTGASESFPRFLGPDGDSVLHGVHLARDWASRPPRLVWQRPVGAGWSGFAIADGRAFTLEQRGELETAAAYDLADGSELWSHGDRAFFTNPMAGPGPRATPTLDGGRVFTFGSTGLLTAYDTATGRRLWQHDVPREHGAAVPEHGMTGSPLAIDGRVVVSAGGPRGHSLVAYDAATGELAWHGGDDGAGYGSPALVTLAGRRQIVAFNRASVAGHDPRDGAVLWTHPWPPDWPNVAPPVVVGADRVLFSTGYGIGSKLLRIGDGGGGPGGTPQQATLVWETPRLKSKFANLALHDGFVYGLDDGVLVCLDPQDGTRRWKGGRYGHGNLLIVGDLLLVQTERGELVMIEATPEERRELGRFLALRGKAWNPMALAGNRLLVRNDAEAALWELPLER